jgi:hypothetical protein
MRELVESIQGEYRRYKKLAEGAIQQLRDEDLSVVGPGEANSVAIVVWHISGNLKSRFTDFLTSDGEKPWRHRDEEFDQRSVTSAELKNKWNDGWDVLFSTLDSLTDNDLHRVVTIRGEQLKVHEALNRSVTHTAYHVGQIVHITKTLRGSDWKTLTIPRGKSQEYNANPTGQRA